ncbi:MAG: zinc ribbon domain-containing protein [Acidobacteriota bacterium]|nr:zinc ribbon domain-containing protein [Acidobacteriota bacterium]
MFCPQCGAQQSDELKFCNLCGANLFAVRQVVSSREAGEKFDWGKTWVAEMFLSESERKRRAAELEKRRGVTAELKRYNEIKGGVITTCVGAGVMFFLDALMEGIIRSGQIAHGDEQILSRLWVAGLIPLLIGLGIIFNGLFVSRKIVEIEKRNAAGGQESLGGATERPTLRSADTSEFVPARFSVTENTTKNLASPFEKQ